MKISEMEKGVDLLFLIEKDYVVKKIGTDKYRINPCPVCGSKDHFTIYPKTNSYSSFSECCQGGSVYKYLQEIKGMSENMAYEELLKLSENKESASNPQPTKAREMKTPSQVYKKTILELYNDQTDQDKSYFINRGMTPALIDKYKLCIGDIRKLNPEAYGRRAIIPVWEKGEVVQYNSRALEADPKCKYIKAPGSTVYFNLDCMEIAEPGSIIIVTEGEFDAMSLETIRVDAIAIQGVQNYDNFKENARDDIIFLTAFDTDKAGTDKTGENSIKIPVPYKDINEWLQADKVGFGANITKQVQEFKIKGLPSLYDFEKNTISDYFNNHMENDLKNFKKYKDRKTGFDNLDEIAGGLYPGLYVLGAISSLGKTTFIHQMGDQLAAAGDHVLFFSLEQNVLEMVTKSISRIMAQKNIDKAVSAINLKRYDLTPEALEAIDQYSKFGDLISIIPCNFDTNINFIINYTNAYMKKYNVKPVVIVDYLQIIPPTDPRQSDKEKVDNIVRGLKKLQSDNQLVVMVVSSINRTNYLLPIDFESFKESGGIEYTADVVWGLSLQCLNDPIFDKKEGIKEKREKVKNAKAANPRIIELVCLKNRYGISNYTCGFNYNPCYDLFEPNYEQEYSINIERL